MHSGAHHDSALSDTGRCSKSFYGLVCARGPPVATLSGTVDAGASHAWSSEGGSQHRHMAG